MSERSDDKCTHGWGESALTACPYCNPKPQPREWWVERELGSNRALLFEPGSISAFRGIHVIEYAAFEQLQRERDEYVAEAEKFQFKCIDLDQANGMIRAALEAKEAECEMANATKDELCDEYKAERDQARLELAESEVHRLNANQSTASILLELTAARAREAKLREALEQLKISGECWCAIAVGDPRQTNHSASCVVAREALKEYTTEPTYPVAINPSDSECAGPR